MQKITMLLVDNHQLVVDGWKYLLEADGRLKVVATANTGKQAVELVASLKPRLVLMDINMDEMDGFIATTQIRNISPGTKIIGVSMHTIPAYAKKMMKAGASGFVTKTSSGRELIKAIIEVVEGRSYICDEVKNIIVKNELGESAGPNINLLSKRELEIVQYVSTGLSSKEISNQLHLSIKTIEVHRYNILKKLALPNSAALVNFINHNGI